MKNILRLCLLKLLFLLVTFSMLWAITPSSSLTQEMQSKLSFTVDLKSDGTVTRDKYNYEYNLKTSLGDISKHLKDAIIATEDRRFRTRNVMYLPARFAQASVECAYRKLKAVIANAIGGNGTSYSRCAGYSTITQQLTKMLWIREERTPFRKILELVWAMKLELAYSKNEILEMYINQVYFGKGAYGAGMGAKVLFGRSAIRLNLFESALVAVSIKTPSENMLANPEEAVADANVILKKMHDQRLINRPARVSLENIKFRGNEPYEKPYFGHIWQWLKPSIENHLKGRPAGRYKIITTVEADVQLHAQQVVDSQIQQYLDSDIPASQAAVVVQDIHGVVIAMIGGAGASEKSRSDNRAIARQGLHCRPPASTIKPVVGILALESHYKPDTYIDARPYRYGTSNEYEIKNFGDLEFPGEITLEHALSKSINTAITHLFDKLGGSKPWKDTLRRVGIPANGMRDEVGNVIGQSPVCLIDMTTFFALIANGGKRVKATGIHLIVNKNGHTIRSSNLKGFQGNSFINWISSRARKHDPREFKKSVIDQLDSMLQTAVKDGTGKSARIGINNSVPVAGKTGTTNDHKDAWFIGYSKEHVIGVWIGNDIPVSMKSLTGGKAATLIFNKILTGLLKSTPQLASVE